MACRAEAEGDGVLPLRDEAEGFIEGGNTEDIGKWNVHLLRNIFQSFLGKIFIFSLYILEDRKDG
jgi:hypothetical protein